MAEGAVSGIRRPAWRMPRPGDLLVAAPSLTDPNFRRTIVYMLQNDEDGSAGVVINRPLERPIVGLDLPEWILDSGPFLAGGPVAQDSMLALARLEAAPPQIRRAVGPGVCVIDLDSIDEVQPFAELRLFVGYAGWSAGQLESELRRDDWAVVPGEAQDILAPDPDRAWWRVLRRQRGALRLWSTLPTLPAAN